VNDGAAGRPERGARRSAASGALTWSEVADAIWLAGQQAASAGSEDEPAAAPVPSGGPVAPPGHRRDPLPDAGPAAPSGHVPAEEWHPPRADPAADVQHASGTDETPKRRPEARASQPSHGRWSVEDTWAGHFPAAPAPLPGRRTFERALRPLKRRADTRRADRELDEEATAVRAAEDGLWLPETRPVRERWLELDVIVDDSRLAGIHHPLTSRFVDCLVSVGAFRTVRTHLCDTDVADTDALLLREPGPLALPRPAAGLVEQGSRDRRLVMMLTDGVGDAWHSGAAQRMLARWGSRCPVLLINVLSRRQWRRTGIVTRPAKLLSADAAAANDRYAVLYPCAEPGSDDFTEPKSPRVHVPVVELDPGQLTGWAGFVAGLRQSWFGSVTVCGPEPEAVAGPAPDEEPDAFDAPDRARPTAPAELVRRFRAAVSPTVYALSVHLAAAPLLAPVMRLVQRTMHPDSGPSDLAELVGSGLLQQVRADGDREEAAFDFLPGVREELLATGLRSETTQVLVTVARHLDDEVGVLPELHEMVVAPHLAEAPAVTEEAAFYAVPAASAFRALSGPYLRLAQDLDASLQSVDYPRAAVATESEPASTVLANPLLQDQPVGTGNGMSRLDAFNEIAEEITYKPPQSGVGVTIRAIPPAAQRKASDPPPIWGSVPARNPSFTGREDLLERLHERLSCGTTAVLPEALHGMGGVGKSQIAIEYVYRHISDYDLIWWIRAEQPGQIRQDLAELAAQMGLPVGTEVNVAIPAVREALRLGRPYRNWLLVFDNAEVLDEAREFFPTNGPGKILVTSRNHAWTEVANSLEVDVFARDESKALLRLRGPELGEDEADELADVLGDLPLAIEQAAVWLSETGMPVNEYLHLFREKHDKAAELLHDAAPAAYELPVAAAWNVSLDQLRNSDPAALQLLQVCAFFAPEPISWRLLSGARNLEGPPELLEALSDPIRLGRAVRAINQYALAKISHRDNTIMLHRLVQRVLVAQMSPQEAAELRHCGHQLLAKSDPGAPDLPTRWNEYAELLPHIQYSDIVDCEDAWARDLVLHEIEFLFIWGDLHGFLKLAEHAVESWTERLGPDDEQTLSATLQLGRALRMHGRFDEAYTHHVRARDILLESKGPEDERTLEAQRFVAADLRYLGQFDRATEIDRKSFESLRRRFGPDDPMTLQQAHLYAIDLRLIGDAKAARDLDRDTYQRLLAIFGENRNKTLGSLAAIAVDEMECGNHEEARALNRENLERIERIFGTGFGGYTAGLNALSVMERKAGDHHRALELSTEAVERYVDRVGRFHPDSISAALNHAVNLRQTGKLNEAISLARETVADYQKMFGPKHPNTPSASVNLAVALRLNGQIEEARKLDTAALEVLDEVLGRDHPRTIVCAINLASDHYSLGDYQTALARDEETLALAREKLGKEHPTTLACTLNYSLDLRAVGREQEAEALFDVAVEGLLKVHGPTHPATISARQGLRADCDIYPIPV
jgi:tetratricopeptide (TPR) repeat protein